MVDIFNACVERNDFTPVALDTIKDYFKQKALEYSFHAPRAGYGRKKAPYGAFFFCLH